MNVQKIQTTKKDKIHAGELYKCFKFWIKQQDPNANIPSDKIFMRNIRKHKKVVESVRINDQVKLGISNLIFLINYKENNNVILESRI